jgi:hypothetical protein
VGLQKSLTAVCDGRDTRASLNSPTSGPARCALLIVLIGIHQATALDIQVIVKKLSTGARLVLKSNYNYEILKVRHSCLMIF